MVRDPNDKESPVSDAGSDGDAQTPDHDCSVCGASYNNDELARRCCLGMSDDAPIFGVETGRNAELRQQLGDYRRAAGMDSTLGERR